MSAFWSLADLRLLVVFHFEADSPLMGYQRSPVTVQKRMGRRQAAFGSIAPNIVRSQA